MSNMPVFVIKAKDALAVEAIIAYRTLCITYGLKDQTEEVKKAILEIQQWQDKHPDLVQMPDHKHVPLEINYE